MNTDNWLERTELLLGKEKLDLLRKAHVLVVGLGGVGAYAAEMIVRAGVGRMTIADADAVAPSNINRQLVALHSTVGRQKAEILAERLRDINPEIELTVVSRYIKDEETDLLLVLDIAADHREFYLRVDVAQAFGQNLGFLAADGRVEGDQLAVDVARRHGVGIGDGHAAHAGPDDHLGGIGAHAAQPDDQYVGLSEQVEFLFAEQQLGAFKPIIRIHFQLLCSFYRAGSGGVPAALSCPCGPVVNIRP